MVLFKMRDSLPSARYSPVCNVLRQWKTSLILTYRGYRLYDYVESSPSINNYYSNFRVYRHVKSNITESAAALGSAPKRSKFSYKLCSHCNKELADHKEVQRA